MESIELTGQALHPDQVARLARETGRTVRAEIAPEALSRAAEAAEAAERISRRQPVYGRTTGVGANRTQHVADGDLGHGLRLLRSHASGIGHLVSPAATRAMLAVRANQLLSGGAGLRPEIIEAIIAALNADLLPEIHEYGGLGTADLTALAELGLALVGERPWIPATPTASPPTPTTPRPTSPLAPTSTPTSPSAPTSALTPTPPPTPTSPPAPVPLPKNTPTSTHALTRTSALQPAPAPVPVPTPTLAPTTAPPLPNHPALSQDGAPSLDAPAPSDITHDISPSPYTPSSALTTLTTLSAHTPPSLPAPPPDPLPPPFTSHVAASAHSTPDPRPPAHRRPVAITSGDALALMSSSALTIGRACLEWRDTSRWVHASHAVAALTHLALDGSMEPFSRSVHDRRPHQSLMISAALMRALLAGQSGKPARIQDPFALRCIPQIHGGALSSLASVEQVLAVELNAAAENPLISVEDDAVYHHGGFHQSLLTQALDALKLALLAVGQLSLARLDLMFHPEFTGLRPFLADGEPASSGVMILENAAHDALAELRNAAMPAGLGHAVLSRGVEDHTPFTSQAVRQAARAGDALQLVLATELVGAMRTLRLRHLAPAANTPLDTLYALAEVLDPDTSDRSTTADVHAAASLLPAFADVAARVLPSAWPHPLGDSTPHPN